MMPFQWLLSVVLCIVIGRILWRIITQPENRPRLALWGILWVLALAVILLPGTSIPLARLLGIGRGVDLAIYCALLLVFYLVYLLWLRVHDLEVRQARVVRALALREMHGVIEEESHWGEKPR